MRRAIGAGIVLALMILPLAYAATTATTPFTFNVPVTRSITITYGGNCSASAFFFNEVDANHDPDPDGNWTRGKPRGTRNIGNTEAIDYNTAGVSSPSSTHRALYSIDVTTVSTGPAIGTEVDTNTYSVIATDDSDVNALKSTTNLRRSIIQGIFRARVEKTRVKDLNFVFIGESVRGSDCQNGNGTGGGLLVDLLNTETNEWTTFKTFVASGDSLTNTKDTMYWEIFLTDSNAQTYVGFDKNVSYRILGPQATAGTPACLFTDRITLRTTEYPIPTDFCQSETIAPITIANVGNTDVNIDGNFTANFGGSDSNIVLKLWMGNGSGCGIDGNGLGGWEETCSVSGQTDPVTATQCKAITRFTPASNGNRITTRLAPGDTNQVCFSGETFIVGGTAFISAGDHNQTYQIGSEYSP